MRTHPSLLALLAISPLALAQLVFPGRADAQEPSGGAQASFLVSVDGELGGAISADVTYAIDWFRVGGFLGVGTVVADEDVRNRVFMPLAASVGVELSDEDVGMSLRARGGLWGGATQEVKLTAGGFLSGALYLLFVLGDGVTASMGLEVWGLLGDGETALFSPSLGLTWTPPISEQPLAAD